MWNRARENKRSGRNRARENKKAERERANNYESDRKRANLIATNAPAAQISQKKYTRLKKF